MGNLWELLIWNPRSDLRQVGCQREKMNQTYSPKFGGFFMPRGSMYGIFTYMNG